tara:strand:- start:402 stop:656 length:255 start_codon:yes stop_codon:yes gene_type:complete
MIPLTQSLYVNAKVKDSTKFTVELGTGFYAEKSPAQTTKFLDRKEALADKNAISIYNVILNTRKNIEATMMVMQQKIEMLNSNQ